MSWSGPRVGKEPEMENLKHSLWGRYQKKIGKMWEFFPSRGPPLPPVWEPHVCEEEKNYGLFSILGP